jgi:GT2 family glycosyltransferase
VTLPVSVVIPTFRRREVLAETLNALRRCQPPPGEILVMVDYGDRETRAVLEPNFPEVRWTEAEERLGPGGARNILFAMAQHPYVASFDDDSSPIDPDFFADVGTLFEENPRAGVIAAGAIVHDGETVPPRTRAIVPAVEFVGCGAVVRREAFLETRGYLPLEFGYGAEEVDVSLQLLDKGWQILSSDALRVRHRTSRAHQARPEVTSAHISNTALVGYLRYPLVLWSFVVVQIGRRVVWSLRNGRSAGVVQGLASIPRNLWRHRAQRAPVKARVILATRGLWRGAP